MKPNWIVAFNGKGTPGREIPINKHFRWAGVSLLIPSVYVCEKGLVMDFCAEIQREKEKDFLKKWVSRVKAGLTGRERRKLQRENPLDFSFNCHLTVNEEYLQNWHSSGSCWVSESLRPEGETFRESTAAWLEHYGLDWEAVWVFRRVHFDWKEPPVEIQSLEAKLYMDDTEVSGPVFSMPEAGQSIELGNPLTGSIHVLTVEEIQKETIPVAEQFADVEMPNQVTVMLYRLEPDISAEKFKLKDIQQQDQARRKDGTPFNNGCMGVILSVPKDGTHAAVSSMHFESPDSVCWEPVFQKKTVQDLEIKLI